MGYLIRNKITSDWFGYHNMDCMDLLRELPDNAVDLAIVDPPYGIGASSMNMGAGKGKNTCNIKNRNWKNKTWDSEPPTSEYFTELRRVSKEQIIWGGNHFNLGPCYGYVIWDKIMPPGVSFADCEMAWTNIRKAPKIFSYSAYLDKRGKFHPTQKPVALYLWLLDNYAKPGQIILDTHVGSGSSLIACIKRGFQYIGTELDVDYYYQSSARIAREKSGIVPRNQNEIIQGGGQISILDQMG